MRCILYCSRKCVLHCYSVFSLRIYHPQNRFLLSPVVCYSYDAHVALGSRHHTTTSSFLFFKVQARTALMRKKKITKPVLLVSHPDGTVSLDHLKLQKSTAHRKNIKRSKESIIQDRAEWFVSSRGMSDARTCGTGRHARRTARAQASTQLLAGMGCAIGHRLLPAGVR